MSMDESFLPGGAMGKGSSQEVRKQPVLDRNGLLSGVSLTTHIV